MPIYDGSALTRQPGKLTITPEGAHWRISVDCPTEVLTCRIAVPSLWECLEAVERVLVAGHVTWSPGWTRTKKKLPVLDELIQ